MISFVGVFNRRRGVVHLAVVGHLELFSILQAGLREITDGNGTAFFVARQNPVLGQK
jgi:hypothetical protein